MKREELERRYSIRVCENDLDSVQGYDYEAVVALDREEADVQVHSRYVGNKLGFGHPDSLDAFADELKGIAEEMRKWPQFKPARKASK